MVNGWARDYDSLTQPIFFSILLLQTRVNGASEGNMSDFEGNMSELGWETPKIIDDFREGKGKGKGNKKRRKRQKGTGFARLGAA